MKVLESVRRGQTLTDKEKKKLFQYLGYVFSVNRFVYAILIASIGAFLFIFGLIRDDEFLPLFLTIGVVLFLIGFYVSFVHNKVERILKYFDALSDFSDYRFKDYAKYDISYIKNLKGPSNPIETNKLYFLTDYFNILLFEDFLVSSPYLLPKSIKTNIKMSLPVYDMELIDKKPLIYTINDIVNYKLVGEKKKDFMWIPNKKLSHKLNEKIEERILLFDQLIEKENYVNVILANGFVIKIDVEIIDVLRKILPQKEAH